MFKEINKLKIQGANFIKETPLEIFSSENNKITLIYGKNGTGKSTIARGINKISGKNEPEIKVAEFLTIKNETINNQTNEIFVFNEDYIFNNIKIKEDGLENIIIFGENIELQKEIDLIIKKTENLQIDAQKTICDKYKDENNSLSPKYYMNKIISSLKGDKNWAERDRRIKNNRQASFVREDTYKNFINQTPQKDRDELIIEFEKKFLEYESAKSKSIIIDISPLKIEEFSFNEKAFLELLKEKIEPPILNDREKFIIEIMNQNGKKYITEIHEYFSDDTHTTCPFCMQTVNEKCKEIIFESIEKILNENVENHQKELQKYTRKEINIDFTQYSFFSDLVNKCKEKLDIFNETIILINKYIDTKFNSIYNPLCVENFNIISKYNSLVEVIEKLKKNIEGFNESITNIDSKVSELNKLNNDITYYDIIENFNKYKEQLSFKEEEEKKYNELFSELTKYNEQQKFLENQKRNIKIAIDSINKGLAYIFYSNNRLYIENTNEKYYIKSNGNSVKPGNISVGERNAIALCYFFTEILKNKNENEMYNQERLLVINDPISSFDIENRIGILSYIKFQLNNFLNGHTETKSIILTHDIQTLYDLEKLVSEIINSCNQNHSEKFNFSILRLSNNKLDTFPLKKYQEYTTLMENIFDYGKGEKPEYEIVIGNSIRRVLEAFGTFIYKKGIDEISTSKEVLSKIHEKYRDYFENLLYRLVLHGGSHYEEHVKSLNNLTFFDYISNEDKIRTAKDILCFIFLLNNLHLLKHLSQKKDVESTINSWLKDIDSNFLNL